MSSNYGLQNQSMTLNNMKILRCKCCSCPIQICTCFCNCSCHCTENEKINTLNNKYSKEHMKFKRDNNHYSLEDTSATYEICNSKKNTIVPILNSNKTERPMIKKINTSFDKNSFEMEGELEQFNEHLLKLRDKLLKEKKNIKEVKPMLDYNFPSFVGGEFNKRNEKLRENTINNYTNNSISLNIPSKYQRTGNSKTFSNCKTYLIEGDSKNDSFFIKKNDRTSLYYPEISNENSTNDNKLPKSIRASLKKKDRTFSNFDIRKKKGNNYNSSKKNQEEFDKLLDSIRPKEKRSVFDDSRNNEVGDNVNNSSTNNNINFSYNNLDYDLYMMHNKASGPKPQTSLQESKNKTSFIPFYPSNIPNQNRKYFLDKNFSQIEDSLSDDSALVQRNRAKNKTNKNKNCGVSTENTSTLKPYQDYKYRPKEILNKNSNSKIIRNLNDESQFTYNKNIKTSTSDLNGNNYLGNNISERGPMKKDSQRSNFIGSNQINKPFQNLYPSSFYLAFNTGGNNNQIRDKISGNISENLISDLKEKNQKLENLLTEKEDLINDLKIQVNNNNNNVGNISKDNSSSYNAEKYEKKLREKDGVLQEKNNEIYRLRKQLGDLEEALKEKELERNVKNNTAPSLSNETMFKDNMLNSLQKQISDLQLSVKEISELRKGNDLEDNLNAMTNQNNALLEEISGKNKEIMNLNGEIKSLKQQLTQKDKILTQNYNNLLEKHNSENVKKMEEIKEITKEILCLKDNFKEITDENSSYKNEIKSLTAEIRELKGTIEKSNKESAGKLYRKKIKINKKAVSKKPIFSKEVNLNTINDKRKRNENNVSQSIEKLSTKLNLDTSLDIDLGSDKFVESKDFKLSNGTLMTVYPDKTGKNILCFDPVNKVFSLKDYSDFNNFEESYKQSLENNLSTLFFNLDGCLYIITGPNCDQLFKYNPQKRTMNKIAALRNNHSAGVLLSFGDSLICVSGEFNKKLEIYSKKSWEEIAELNIERANACANIINNQFLFVFFGYNIMTNRLLNTIEYMDLTDIENSEFKYLRYRNDEDLNMNLAGMMSVNYNDEKIIFLGGVQGDFEHYLGEFYQLKLGKNYTGSNAKVEKTGRKLLDSYKNDGYYFNCGMHCFTNGQNKTCTEAFDKLGNAHVVEEENMVHDIVYLK